MEEREAAVERLREFLRFNYATGTQAARRIGVRDPLLVASGQKQIEVCCADHRLSRLSAGGTSGHPGDGYEYREYKNWRGIPKPRRCPFCKQAKGEIRKVEGRVSRLLSELRSDGAETGGL